MQTAVEDSYVCAIECKNCSLLYSVSFEDLVDPLACPYCGTRELPLSPDMLLEPCATSLVD